MRDLNYQLKQLCRCNQDGSYAITGVIVLWLECDTEVFPAKSDAAAIVPPAARAGRVLFPAGTPILGWVRLPAFLTNRVKYDAVFQTND